MKLKIYLPSGVLLDEEVIKVTAEAENGFFTLLPRHIDFVTSLAAGILYYILPAGNEKYLALDEGILIKQGERVMVSSPRAIGGYDLDYLRELVEDELKDLDENEKKARSVLSRLEADTIRRFTRLKGAV